MKEYVLGFLFSEDKNLVALVIKDRPEWQAGKLNGIGGKVESDETIWTAMPREFKEETGVEIKEWDQFAVLEFHDDVMGGSASVYCFRAFSDLIYQVSTQETEKIVTVPVGELPYHSRVDHLEMLVLMALNPNIISAEITLK